MGTITAYAISIAIILLIEYVLYKCLLANATFYRFNRGVLMSCYILALVAIPAANLLEGITTGSAAGAATIGPVEIGTPVTKDVTFTESATATDIFKMIPVIYMLGIIAVAILTIISYTRMALIIHRGEKRAIDGAVIVIADTKVSPFSWGKYLVVSPDDADNRLIIEHELTHIRCRHSLDLIFAQAFIIFNWFNPAAYLMRRELSAVHEYDVDRRLLNSGIKASDYQMLLIRKTVGPGFQSIANSLNHSQLKNRLTMMMKSKSRSVRHLCAAALLPAAVLAAAMTDFGAVASTINNVAAVSYDKVSENSTDVQQADAIPAVTAAETTETKDKKAMTAPEVLPQYPGGNRELLLAIMGEVKYPEDMLMEEKGGMTVIRFTVNTDGEMGDFEVIKSSGYEVFDTEALRALKAGATQKWIPGTVDGKPVNCTYTIPIKFATKAK